MRTTAAALVVATLGWVAVGTARADTPLPPPQKHTATSPSKQIVAESDPATGLTTVYRVTNGVREPRWAMAGWYRAIYPADDGEHLVLGFDGLNLAPKNAPDDLVVLRFVRRGEVVAALTLHDVVPDRSALRPTASHVAWRQGEGFDAAGRFVVVTMDGVAHAYDVTTGRPVAAPEGPATAAGAGGGGDLDRLAAWMSGSFSSAAQATADKDYFDVRLHIVPVWKTRTDARWFYVEQAIASAPDKPYRQRVYRLRALADGLFESKVFELAEPAAAIGAWAQAEPLAALSPATLVDRPGCAVMLRALDPDTFAGSTLGSQCLSGFRGAAYATSEVTVTAKGLVSWDRGYDAAGKQVWGATKGGYHFDRIDVDAGVGERGPPPPAPPPPAPAPAAPETPAPYAK